MAEPIVCVAFTVRAYQFASMPFLFLMTSMFIDFVVDETIASRIQTAKSFWGTVRNASIVSFHLAFSSQELGDRSLFLVSDYHADSVTLFQSHVNNYGISLSRRAVAQIPENVIWNYMVQIANALKTIHTTGIAARLVESGKMLITDENRVRFNGCAIADVLDPANSNVAHLQQQDLEDFGNLVIWLATFQPPNKPVEYLLRSYHPHLTNAVEWLVHSEPHHTIDHFLEHISFAVLDSFNASLQLDDNLQFNLNRELENSRIVRLLLKLNSINERPEHEEDTSRSEYSPRGQVKLFRDYIFHQVDAQGRPSLDAGHMIACLNKLDVGLDEKVPLTTRDGKSVIIVTYREMKQAIESAWIDLLRRSHAQ